MREPPADTRARTRALLLRRFGAEQIDEVDWDVVRVRLPPRDGRRWSEERVVHLHTQWEIRGTFDELQDCRIAGLKEVGDEGTGSA